MIKEQFFPTNIYGKDVKLDNKLFTNEIVEWSKRDPGVKKTNRNGWHSTTEMHKMPVFKPLVNELFLMMNDIWKEEWLDREPILGNMWANINPPGGYNAPHIHPNSLFSGVYYVKIPAENSGKFVCRTKDSWNQFPLPRKTYRNWPETMEYNPGEGKLLLFESDLMHMVEPNETHEDRISISFYYQFVMK